MGARCVARADRHHLDHTAVVASTAECGRGGVGRPDPLAVAALGAVDRAASDDLYTRDDSMKRPQQEALLATLASRFAEHMARHPEVRWAEVLVRLEANPKKLVPLQAMEESGGEPDVIGQDATSGEYIFCDCSAESPNGRRSLCYDRAGLESRKEHRPETSAIERATAMGIEVLTEEEYRALQAVGPVDCKTSSWLRTPPEIRKRGGAIFGDRRFGRVFVYHNGAQSYYAGRGFRGTLRV
jgi:hypothetical protein